MEVGASCDSSTGLLSGDERPCVHGCACDANIQSLAKALVLKDGNDNTRSICGFCCSGNLQVLVLTFALFGTVTFFQTAGAIIGHSEAMLADSCAMWVDCMTYLLNIIAEACEGRWFHKHLQLTIPAVSLSTLIYATVSVLGDAISTLSGSDSGDDDDDVNPCIVLGFSLWCMFFDFTALFAFFRNQRKSKDKGGLPINMLVACAHVGADFCRSVTTLTESMLIMVFNFDGTSTDAWSCVVVSFIILLGTAFPIWEWLKTVSRFCKSEWSTLHKVAVYR